MLIRDATNTTPALSRSKPAAPPCAFPPASTEQEYWWTKFGIGLPAGPSSCATRWAPAMHSWPACWRDCCSTVCSRRMPSPAPAAWASLSQARMVPHLSIPLTSALFQLVRLRLETAGLHGVLQSAHVELRTRLHSGAGEPALVHLQRNLAARPRRHRF